MICSCKVQDAWSNMFQAPLAGNPLQVTHNYPQLLLPIWSLCLLSLLRYIKSRGYSDSEKLATPQKWRNKKRSFDVTLLNSFESRDDVDFLTYNISTIRKNQRLKTHPPATGKPKQNVKPGIDWKYTWLIAEEFQRICNLVHSISWSIFRVEYK